MTVKIEHAMIKRAVKRAGIAAKDVYVLRITPHKEEKSGNYIASLCTCDSTAGIQAVAFLLVSVDGMPDTATEMIFGKDFTETVAAMTAFAPEDALTLQPDGHTCTVSCGTATVTLPLLAEAALIESVNPKEHAYVQIEADTEKLKHAVEIGSAAMVTTEGKTSMTFYRNSVALQPVKKANGNYALRILSIDTLGIMVSGAQMDILPSAGLDDMIAQNRIVALNGTAVQSIVLGAAASKISFLFFDKQVIVREVNDFYLLTPMVNEAKWTTMCNLLYGDASMEMTYKACVFKRQMLGAADIVALAASSVTGVDGRKCAVEIGDGKVTMRGVASTNTVVIPAEDTDGSICIGINSTYLKLVARLGEKIRFHGAGAQAPIHFTNNEEGMHILVLPIQLNTKEQREEVKGTA